MEIIHLILGKADPERMNGVNKVVYQLATQQHLFGEQVAVWGITSDTTVNYNDRNFEMRLFLKQKKSFCLFATTQRSPIEQKRKSFFSLTRRMDSGILSFGSFFLQQQN